MTNGRGSKPKNWDGDMDTLPPLEAIEYWSVRDFDEMFESRYEAFWAGVALTEDGREKWPRSTEGAQPRPGLVEDAVAPSDLGKGQRRLASRSDQTP